MSVPLLPPVASATASIREPHGTPAASFMSILFSSAADEIPTTVAEPEHFRDLSLDQVEEALCAGRGEYHLEAIFRSPLTEIADVAYRHAVMRDLEVAAIAGIIRDFAGRMQTVRRHLAAAKKLYYKYQAERRFLTAAETYVEGVKTLRSDLERLSPASKGLTTFHALLTSYENSKGFITLKRGIERLNADLSSIRYSLLLRDSSITVLPYEEGSDYGATVQEVFAKFRGGKAKDYLAQLRSSSEINHIEAQILDFVAHHNPEPFAALDAFNATHQTFIDKAIARFDREIQFYIAYLEFTENLARAGFALCYPKVSAENKNVSGLDTYDLALAWKLREAQTTVVRNDFALNGEERLFVVTGPNQGGKTTYARVFGQMHYLASLGGLVAGRQSFLFLPDRILSHFEREEDISTLRGGLENELVRMHRLLGRATPASVVLINEMFASTSVADAAFLSVRVFEKLLDLDLLGVCVTFLDELGALSEKTVSVVAGVAPDNPDLRTHKVERRKADGLAYAVAIAEKYGLTYARLKERLAP